MKHLKLYESYQTEEEIAEICKKYGITNWSINEDGLVDVDGGVNLYKKSLNKLPLKFGKVGGNFWCNGNQLTTLEGCPTEVGGDIYCFNNQLTIINWKDIYTLYDTRIVLGDNPIYEIYNIFPDFKMFKASLEWNYFKEPNIIIKERILEACEVLSEETGKNIIVPEKIKGYIFE